jgi:hypothetical protein
MEAKQSTTGRNVGIVIVCVIILVALILIFKGSISKQVEVSFKSDIAIKRTDGLDPLKMPYKYSEILLNDKYLYKNEIAGISISSAKYEISDTGIKWDGFTNVLVNTNNNKAKDVFDSIKYCKGITNINTIVLDKGESGINLYEGYSADLMISSRENYVIIPSSISRYINSKLPAREKALTMRYADNSDRISVYTIISEYTTKNEYDTLYVSYSGFSELIMAEENDISEHVDSIEIDVYEGKDLTNLVEYLSQYFADGNASYQYTDMTNILDEPYQYKYVHSMNIAPVVLETPEESPEIFGKNIFTILRIDGNTDLGMSYKYADALIRDYNTYSQYITDIIISTDVFGVDPNDYPPFTNIPSYGLHLGFSEEFTDMLKENPQLRSGLYYHQAVTSMSEIKIMKSDCEVTFYGDYTNKDLVVPKKKDCTGFIKGYAIIPVTFDEASQNKGNLAEFDYYFLLSEQNSDPISYRIMPGFKVIGYYVTTDKYDTIYITYAGNNEKYKKEPYNSEYINSITIETRSDMDITPLIEYLELLFAPADDTTKYAGENNALNMAYEFCYTMTEDIE